MWNQAQLDQKSSKFFNPMFHDHSEHIVASDLSHIFLS